MTDIGSSTRTGISQLEDKYEKGECEAIHGLSLPRTRRVPESDVVFILFLFHFAHTPRPTVRSMSLNIFHAPRFPAPNSLRDLIQIVVFELDSKLAFSIPLMFHAS